MAEQEQLAQAKATFETLCKALDNHKLRYQKHEETLSVECGIQGDDLPMEFDIRVDAKRMLIMVLSKLPAKIKEEKRLDVAVAVSAINNMLADGCFDYDVASGNMFFRMTNSFLGSTIGEEVFAYLLFFACEVIDAYNDKFLMLSTGMLSLEQFLQSLAN